MPDGNALLDDESLLVLVTKVERHYTRIYAFFETYVCPLTDSEINVQQMLLLLRLPSEGCNIQDVCGGNKNYNVTKLEKEGLITRQKTSDDRRCRIIRRTGRGDEVVRRYKDQLSTNPSLRAELQLLFSA